MPVTLHQPLNLVLLLVDGPDGVLDIVAAAPQTGQGQQDSGEAEEKNVGARHGQYAFGSLNITSAVR